MCCKKVMVRAKFFAVTRITLQNYYVSQSNDFGLGYISTVGIESIQKQAQKGSAAAPRTNPNVVKSLCDGATAANSLTASTTAMHISCAPVRGAF